MTREGHLVYSTTDRSIEKNRGVHELDWNGKPVWDYACPVDHDHVLLENGNILMFDNACHSPEKARGYSRILEVNPVKEKIIWEYKSSPPEDFYSPYVSNQQKLPNGNVLVCSGGQGRIFEITIEKEIVWDYYIPFCSQDGRTSLYRHSGRYAPEFIEPFLK